MNTLEKFFKSSTSRTKYFILLAGFLTTVGLFASLADEVHEGETLAVDNSILTGLRTNFASPQLDSAISVLTDIGGTEVIGLATIVLVGYFIYRHAYSRALFTVLVMAGIALAVTFLKLIFGRERPDVANRITTEDTFSFPSGHAMGSAGLAILLGVLAWRTKWRWPVIVAAVFYTVFVGVSRLYLNVHYPTDVIAGWLLAAGWVIAVYTVFRTNKRLRV